MAVVQCMKKGSGMKKIINFKDAYMKRITRMVKPYDEGRIIFDRYDIAQSLKQKTRAKRPEGKEMEFAIYDEKDIAKITLKELLSASKTKALLSHILCNALLDKYKGSKKKVVVVKGTSVQNFRSIIPTLWLSRCRLTIMSRQTP